MPLTNTLQFSASKDAQSQTANANKEVILAAGSLHSPQLLQVSGIGDATLHKAINVPTVVDLPAVGQNLHDHVLLTVVYDRMFKSLLACTKRPSANLTCYHSQHQLAYEQLAYEQRNLRRRGSGAI